MKKAFDANVSRARPRVRLGALTGEPAANEVDLIAERVALEALSVHARPTPPAASSYEFAMPNLARAVRTRATEARAPKASAAQALQQALQMDARLEAPPAVTEVQTAPAPAEEFDVGERRERLKERLKAVRENPRPEPLPETVAEAGVLAVERISALQTELVKVRTLNLALTQDLEATRRQSERATEEARLRMDEARRLSSEMEGRAKLLNDLERELGALEGERNEALLALQESRQQLDAREHEKDELKTQINKHAQALSESLSEEERLAAELESAHEASSNLRRSTDALRSERDTLARQVSDLTRERADLLEARKALEAVHRALSQAVSR